MRVAPIFTIYCAGLVHGTAILHYLTTNDGRTAGIMLAAATLSILLAAAHLRHIED